MDQSYDVSSSTGDNFNHIVSTQVVTNIGNAQNQIGITQIGSEADNFEIEDSGSSIDVSPTNRTSSNQKVGQAASSFGGKR